MHKVFIYTQYLCKVYLHSLRVLKVTGCKENSPYGVYRNSLFLTVQFPHSLHFESGVLEIFQTTLSLIYCRLVKKFYMEKNAMSKT